MSQYSTFILAVLFLLLLFFSKSFRRFSLRGILGVSALFLINLLNIGVSFNYLGIILSSLLGIPGALSFVAISHILA